MSDVVAILYDFENSSYEMLNFAIRQAQKISTNVRIVSDWATRSTKPKWNKMLNSNGVFLVQVERRKTGKNSLDNALFDSAVILLQEGVHNYIIVTSDTDFADIEKLFPNRSSIYILGIGGICSSKKLRESYDRFIYYPPAAACKIKSDSCIPSVEPIEEVRNILISAYELVAQRTKWVTMPQLGSALKILFPKFSFPQDHPSRLRSIIKIYHTSFEWKRNGNILLVKRKEHT